MLSIKNLKKSFDEKVLFENFSYDFKDIGVYVLRGDSGRGKTTLLRMISGLDDDYSGTIKGGGTKNVSVSFQEYRLFPNLTLLDNILVIRENWTDDEIAEIKERLSYFGFKEEEFSLFPHEMSGGMKQRISFLRAVYKNAPILLLDEPTKELDPLLVEKTTRLIMEESTRRLVILVTHLEEFSAFDNAVIIEL